MSEEKYKYQIRATTKFKKSAKLAAKRGKDTQKLKDVVEKLAKGEPLDPHYATIPFQGTGSTTGNCILSPTGY